MSNDTQPTAAPAPQAGPTPAPQPAAPRVFVPLDSIGFGSLLEALLRRPGALLHALGGERAPAILVRLLILILGFAAVYGVVLGSLSGGTQLWAAPLKLCIGFPAAMLLCLPSLYIFLCLDGADVRLPQVVGALCGTVALLLLLMIGFAPVAWIFSQSTDSVVLMGFLHLLFWMIGLWFGVRLVHGLLIQRGLTDRGHVRVWILIFTLVSLQMTTVLRPLVGKADTFLPTEKKFFLQHWGDSMGKN